MTLRVRGLRLRYPGAPQDAVDGVGFDVPAGSLTALLGPSGCGKTSVLRVIAGLATPAAGSVQLDGVELTTLPPEARRVGLTFPSGALFPHLTVEENVRFPLAAAGVQSPASALRVRDAMQAAGVETLAARRPAELSGGEQQRVALARALAQAPAVLLLDEPLAAVEPRRKRALREEIRALQARHGLTVVYVTHDQREGLAVADQVVLMDRGRVVQAGSPRKLYESPVNAFAAAFLGDGSIVPGERGADGEVRLGALPLPQRHPGPAGPVQVVVRPEAWRLHACRGEGLPGSVRRRRYLGTVHEYLVATPLAEVLVHAPANGVPLEDGAPVSLGLAATGAWVLAA